MGQRGHCKSKGLYFSMERQRKSSIGNRNFVHHTTVSEVKRGEFVSDRLSYIVLRSHWYNIIILNVHAPSEEKSDDSKDSFYEELEQVFDHLPKYRIRILLGDFNAKCFQTDNLE